MFIINKAAWWLTVIIRMIGKHLSGLCEELPVLSPSDTPGSPTV